jgi:Flp pilus assembly protein TadD
VQQQITKVPQSAAFYFLLGSLHTALNELDKAEVAFNKTIELNKDFMDAYLALAQVQVERGGQEQAIATYERGIQQNPRDLRAFLLLGTLMEKRKDLAKAKQYYTRALQVDPESALAANNLAYLMIETGDNADVALSYAQVARRAFPSSPNIADTLGWAYYHKKAFGLAIPLFEEALKSQPENPTYHYHLGAALLRSGDKTRARQHLERALSIGKDFAEASKAREALAELGG